MSMMEYYERKQEYDNKNMNKWTCQRSDSVTFIKLTKQDSGRYIYIARDKVVAVTLNTSGYYERPDGTMVLTSTGVFYIVKETPESVIGLLTKEG